MSLVQQLGPHLPFLRRYARALTGTQKSGDSYVKAALQALASGTHELDNMPPRVALYRLFQVIWGADRSPAGDSRRIRRRALPTAFCAFRRSTGRPSC